MFLFCVLGYKDNDNPFKGFHCQNPYYRAFKVLFQNQQLNFDLGIKNSIMCFKWLIEYIFYN